MTLSNLEYALQLTCQYLIERIRSIQGSDWTDGTSMSSIKKQLDELQNIVDNITSFEIQIVDELPTENIRKMTLYFVSEKVNEEDLYKEYMWINEKWEYIGSTRLDLSAYALKEELHEHDNKTILDLINESSGHLTYNGIKIRPDISKNANNALKELPDGFYVSDESYTDEEIQAMVDEINGA